MKHISNKEAWDGEADCVSCTLRKSVLFANLNEQDFEQIHQPIDIYSLPTGSTLYRSGDTGQAAQRLRQTMLSNLYLIPHLLGREQDELDIWHGTNYEQKGFLEYVPAEIWALWDAPALQWAGETYDSPKLRRVRARFIEIQEQCQT